MNSNLIKILLFVSVTVLVFSLFGNLLLVIYFQSEQQKNVNEINRLTSVIKNRDDLQVRQKNEIAQIWKEQTALNDQLIRQQQSLNYAMEDYFRLIAQSIRFVRGEPQFFDGVQEQTFLDKQNLVRDEMLELEETSKENSNKKSDFTKKIDQIYINAGEDQNNKANPNGIR